MRNRIIAIVLVVALIPCLLAVPAFADDNLSFSVLDFSLPFNGDSAMAGLSGSGSDLIWFDVPQSDSYYYIDILVRTDALLTSCVLVDSNDSLTLQPVDYQYGTVYRIYGNLKGYELSRLNLNFGYSYGSVIFFLKFHVTNYPLTNFQHNWLGYGHTSGNSEIYFYNDGSNNLNAMVPIYDVNANWYWDVICEPMYHDDWKKYDYIDIVFTFITSSVTSVAAYYNGTVLPIDYEFYDPGPSSTRENLIHLNIRLYLDDIDRTLNDYPIIYISGESMTGVNAFGILSSTGFIVPDQPSGLRYWFSKVGDWFSAQIAAIGTWGQNIVNSIASWGQGIINAINPDAVSSEEIENVAADKSDQVSDLTGQMDSVAKPDLNGSGDISGIISPGDLTSYTTFLSVVVNAPYISQVVMLSLILSLAAYVLFGKR